MLSTRQAAASGSTSFTHLFSAGLLPRRLFFSSALHSSASSSSTSNPTVARPKHSGKQQETHHRSAAQEGAYKFHTSKSSRISQEERRTAAFGKRNGSGSSGGKLKEARWSSAPVTKREQREGKGSMQAWDNVMHGIISEDVSDPPKDASVRRPRFTSTTTRRVPKAEQDLSDKLEWYSNQARRGDAAGLYRQAAELIELVPENRELVRGSVALQGQYIWLMCKAGRIKEAFKQIESMKKSGIYPTPAQYGTLFAALSNQADVKSYTTLLDRCASYFVSLLELSDADLLQSPTQISRVAQGGTSAALALSRAKVVRQATNDTSRVHSACASYIRLLIAAERVEEARATYRDLVRRGRQHMVCLDAVLNSIKRTNEDEKIPLGKEDARLLKELLGAVRELHAPEQMDTDNEHHVHRLKYVARRLAYLCMQPVEGDASQPELKLLPLLRSLVDPTFDKRTTPPLPESLRIQALSEMSFYYMVVACVSVRDTKLLGLIADKCLRTSEVSRLDCFSPYGAPPFRTQAVRALRLCAEEKDARTAHALLLASRGTSKWQVRTANYAHPLVVSYFYAMSAAPNWTTAKSIFRMYTFDRMNGVFKSDLKYGEASHQIRWKGREAPHKVEWKGDESEVAQNESAGEVEGSEDSNTTLEETTQSEMTKASTPANSTSAPSTSTSVSAAQASLLAPPPVFYINERSSVERLQDQLSPAAANREDHLITRMLLSASTTHDAHGNADHAAVLESLRLLNVLRPFEAHPGAPLRSVDEHEWRARYRPDKGQEPSLEHRSAQAKLQLARALMSSINLLRDSPRGEMVPGETELLSKVHRRALACLAKITGKTEEREREQNWMMRGVVEKSSGLKLTEEDFRELRRGGDAA